MKYLFFMSIIFFVGCTKYSEYTEKNGIVIIRPISHGAGEVKIIDWRVGPLRRQKVSKGIRMQVNFPLIERGHLQDLVDKRGVDSWLIRVRRRGPVGSDFLGWFYAPIIKAGRKANSPFRVRQVKAGFIHVYYAAAAVSTRFEGFMCPAFKHSKKIDNFEKVNSYALGKVLSVSPAEQKRVMAKIEPFSYRPFVINGGADLTGEYSLEFALFNFQDKKIMSNFVEVSERIKIAKEIRVTLKGCDSFVIPAPNEDSDKVKQFKFGR